MYYMMHCFGPEDADYAQFEYRKDDPIRSWHSGKRFDRPPPEPIEIRLDPDAPGVPREFMDEPLPVMSSRLLAALRSAGVNNLDAYRVIVRDEVQDKVYEHYFAVNIVGKIAAADLEKSEFDASVPWFDGVVINEPATRGALMFRLAESVNAILVHEKVKKQLEAAGIMTLTFVRPEQWAG